MDWKKLLGSITVSVDEELWLRNAYLEAENRILRQQIRGRVRLTDSDRKALAEIGKQLAGKHWKRSRRLPSLIPSWRGTASVGTNRRSVPRGRMQSDVPALPRSWKTLWCGWPERIVRGAMTALWVP